MPKSSWPKTVDAHAPAKINLALHVTGRRPDGYHLLDSLVAFAAIGDEITCKPSDDLTFRVTGPHAAGVPTGPENLVLRAAGIMGVERVSIELNKHLPVAAGLGGGSSDAAATLRALSKLTGHPLPAGDALLRLGADVPVCLRGQSARIRGIGERIDSIVIPALAAVLINPGVSVSTSEIFRALPQKTRPPMPETMPEWKTVDELSTWLTAQRNDLETPAIAFRPIIADALAALRNDDVLLARMSGSGATCFGICSDAKTARNVAKRIADAHPDWWVMSSGVT
ncbi:MAG: 4-(cytidine 5'-diphospho)-2-C-methyl-D-erythritol kinase [Pseudomonadota bacterium]